MESGDDYPISCVTIDAVKRFIKKLNKKNRQFRYRLPTCDEWLYIATCENKQKYCWGNTDDYKEFENIAESKYRFEISPTGSLKKNALGLYDMCGNVRELCEYNRRIRTVGSSHYSLEPIVSRYRLGPTSGFRIVKEER
jgi:formylglycine-generating enzyme required for sulfatase activity